MAQDRDAAAGLDHPAQDDGAGPVRRAPLPFVFGRLDKTRHGIVVTLADSIRQAEQAEERVDRWVVQARAHGVSWSIIGAVAGLTSEGARKRWGSLQGTSGPETSP